MRKLTPVIPPGRVAAAVAAWETSIHTGPASLPRSSGKVISSSSIYSNPAAILSPISAIFLSEGTSNDARYRHNAIASQQMDSSNSIDHDAFAIINKINSTSNSTFSSPMNVSEISTSHNNSGISSNSANMGRVAPDDRADNLSKTRIHVTMPVDAERASVDNEKLEHNSELVSQRRHIAADVSKSQHRPRSFSWSAKSSKHNTPPASSLQQDSIPPIVSISTREGSSAGLKDIVVPSDASTHATKTPKRSNWMTMLTKGLAQQEKKPSIFRFSTSSVSHDDERTVNVRLSNASASGASPSVATLDAAYLPPSNQALRVEVHETIAYDHADTKDHKKTVTDFLEKHEKEHGNEYIPVLNMFFIYELLDKKKIKENKETIETIMQIIQDDGEFDDDDEPLSLNAIFPLPPDWSPSKTNHVDANQLATVSDSNKSPIIGTVELCTSEQGQGQPATVTHVEIEITEAGDKQDTDRSHIGHIVLHERQHSFRPQSDNANSDNTHVRRRSSQKLSRKRSLKHKRSIKKRSQSVPSSDNGSKSEHDGSEKTSGNASIVDKTRDVSSVVAAVIDVPLRNPVPVIRPNLAGDLATSIKHSSKGSGGSSNSKKSLMSFRRSAGQTQQQRRITPENDEPFGSPIQDASINHENHLHPDQKLNVEKVYVVRQAPQPIGGIIPINEESLSSRSPTYKSEKRRRTPSQKRSPSIRHRRSSSQDSALAANAAKSSRLNWINKVFSIFGMHKATRRRRRTNTGTSGGNVQEQASPKNRFKKFKFWFNKPTTVIISTEMVDSPTIKSKNTAEPSGATKIMTAKNLNAATAKKNQIGPFKNVIGSDDNIMDAIAVSPPTAPPALEDPPMRASNNKVTSIGPSVSSISVAAASSKRPSDVPKIDVLAPTMHSNMNITMLPASSSSYFGTQSSGFPLTTTTMVNTTTTNTSGPGEGYNKQFTYSYAEMEMSC